MSTATIRENETEEQTQRRQAVDCERHAAAVPIQHFARNASAIMNGTQQVARNNIGSRLCEDGSPANECRHCRALRWKDEIATTLCCCGGKVHVPHFQDPPASFKELWEGNTTEARVFRDFSRQINNALALASQKVHEPPPSGHSWTPTVIIQGKLYHFMGPLQASPGETPRFAQIYVHDPAHDEEEANLRLGNIRLPASTTANQRNLLLILLRRLQADIRTCNPYVQDFIQACEIADAELGDAKLVINSNVRPSGEHERRYNLSFKEVSVLMSDEPGQRDLVLQKRQGGLLSIPDTHRAADPLHFVLLFPEGTDGWHLGLTHVNPLTKEPTTKRTTAREFYAFHLHQRQNSSETLFRAQRLFQEYCCMAFATTENQRLFYIRTNQTKLRAELYKNLCDTINAHDVTGAEGNPTVGQSVILPPSFAGGPRDMHRRYQDAMAIVRKYHKPDFFITFTCNPNWKEINDALLPGQKPEDRPDLVARVFKLKLKSLINEINKGKIFGRVPAMMYVIEFQKRGLPHSHILIILHKDDRLRTADDVDHVICAELPPDPVIFEDGSIEKEQARRLQDTILHTMLHGPCGEDKPTAPCMKDGSCEKSYPKPFCENTAWSEREMHPTYRRRSTSNGGRQIVHGSRVVENRWVVPYNPYLTLKYEAHINVEACISSLAAKYLFKYVTKGCDRAMVRVERDEPQRGISNPRPRNEINDYQDVRSIGSSEACWRLFSFDISDRKPAVIALRVHLPDQQRVYFEEGQERQAADAREETRTTELTAFFAYNERHPGTNTAYCDFPEHFTWNKSTKKWTGRKAAMDTIGRVYTIHPMAGDIFYLRMLLTNKHSRGATSYDDLKTVRGNMCQTFQDACKELGLLQEDDEWDMVLTDAAATQMCPQIRELFVVLLLFCNPSDPLALFERHHTEWWDDFQRHFSAPPEEYLLRAMVLVDLERRLQQAGKGLQTFQLQQVDDHVRVRVRELHGKQQQSDIPSVIQEELDFDSDSISALVEERMQHLTPSQRILVDAVLQAIFENRPLAAFLDARGGTGKTYTLNTLLAAVRTHNQGKNIALAVASSGIAATLLLMGRTFHSRFKAPVNITENSSLSISAQSALANLIQQSKLIVWDEAPMAHRHLLEALDRTLKDIMKNNHPFGGKVIVLAGDFRQVLPIIKHGSRAEIVNACIKRSLLWKHFKVFQLTENMRILRNGQQDAALIQFDNWLLSLGNGTLASVHNLSDYIQLRDELCMPIDTTDRRSIDKSLRELISWVFPQLQERYSNYQWMAERAILAPTNSMVDEINAILSIDFPGEPIVLSSADNTANEDDATRITIEYLNSLNAAGLPPHHLYLKTGMILILLRNLNPKMGLCNGTRLILIKCHNNRILECQIASGEHVGRIVFIPRITLQPSDSDFPFEWQRRQFPVRVAFAMTINKSQGQTLMRVGVWLEEPVFTHGQLYVSASRVGHPLSIRFAIKQGIGMPPIATRNVVYHEVLHRDI